MHVPAMHVVPPMHEPQFIKLIFDGHGLERWRRVVGRCGCKRCLGRRCSRDGGWSRRAEFEQLRLQWKFEQFERRIVRRRRRRRMVSVTD